ncbi:MAG: phosphopyruvate hydratase [Candidatus Omnitrophica bacterium]|nr:phosphopyruvate hydratase [Candidatus Omnitrophota bacterium]
MPNISQIIAREILDSRGNPTVECSLLTDSGHFGTGSVPSGASTGRNEALELRDGDQTRYLGMGVLKAVSNINDKIAPKLVGRDVTDQEGIDQLMCSLDGTDSKKNLGANAILAVSIAALKAAAQASGLPLFAYINRRYRGGGQLHLPGPVFNLINGGKHGAGNLDFQEFQIIPSTRFPFHQALQLGTEIFHLLKAELIHRNAIHSVGDEGGFAPNLFTNSDALELLALVIKNSPYQLHQDVFLSLDVAADSFYKDKRYVVKDAPKPLDSTGMINLYTELLKDYPLFALEDPLDQDDWAGWAKLKETLPNNTLLVGDDFISTNKKQLSRAVSEKACNAVIVKPNQIGSVSETIELVNFAREHNVFTIASHRSGETNDPFIADFAVGIGTNFAKFGAPDRGERVAKYNRLLEIESYLSSQSS